MMSISEKMLIYFQTLAKNLRVNRIVLIQKIVSIFFLPLKSWLTAFLCEEQFDTIIEIFRYKSLGRNVILRNRSSFYKQLLEQSETFK